MLENAIQMEFISDHELEAFLHARDEANDLVDGVWPGYEPQVEECTHAHMHMHTCKYARARAPHVHVHTTCTPYACIVM